MGRAFLCLFWVVICATTLAACTGDRIVSESDLLQGNVLIWHSLENEAAKLVNSSFNEFKQLNPDVNLIGEYNPNEATTTRFIQHAQNGLGASAIIDFTRDIPLLAQKKVIQPIDPQEIDLSIYYPQALSQVRFQKKIYGIPIGSHTRVLCYNQAKLQSSPDPSLRKPPTSLEELVERARKGYSVGMISSFEDTFWGMGLFGGSILDKQGNIDLQLTGWAKWIKWLKTAMIQPNFILIRANRAFLHDAFARGQLAYYVCNADEIANLKNTLQDDLQIALLPRNNAFNATPLLYTRALIFNRSAAPNEMRLALALARFMTNPEQQLQGVVRTESFIPTNRKVLLDDDLFPLESVLSKQATTAVAIPLDELERLFPFFERAEKLYQQAIAGELAPSEAARQLTLLIDREPHQHHTQ